MSKKVVKGCKKDCKTGHDGEKLTKTEAEILYLLTEEKLTEQQASIRRGCSQQAINRHKQNLIRKGFMTPFFSKVVKSEGCLQHNNQIRLHGEHFVLKPIWKGKPYKTHIGRTIYIDGNCVKVHMNSIEVYSNVSFFGETPSIADSKSQRYWLRFFNRLQNDLRCILMKDRSQNITRVRSEYAETNNEFAKKFYKENEKVRITGEDGKIWLVFDNSFGFHEMETTHPKNSKFDMEVIMQPFVNDLRKIGQEQGSVPRISDILQTINALAIQNKEIAMGLNAIVKLISPTDETDLKKRERADYFG